MSPPSRPLGPSRQRRRLSAACSSECSWSPPSLFQCWPVLLRCWPALLAGPSSFAFLLLLLGASPSSRQASPPWAFRRRLRTSSLLPRALPFLFPVLSSSRLLVFLSLAAQAKSPFRLWPLYWPCRPRAFPFASPVPLPHAVPQAPGQAFFWRSLGRPALFGGAFFANLLFAPARDAPCLPCYLLSRALR